jgi:hypothetical protein
LLAAVGADDEHGAVVHESGEEFLVHGEDFVGRGGFSTEGASARVFIELGERLVEQCNELVRGAGNGAEFRLESPAPKETSPT